MKDFDTDYKLRYTITTDIDNSIDQLLVQEVKNFYHGNYLDVNEHWRVNARKITEALDKQFAKKVNFIDWYPHCPNCNNDRLYTEDDKNMKYCYECGQKLDWSVNND